MDGESKRKICSADTVTHDPSFSNLNAKYTSMSIHLGSKSAQGTSELLYHPEMTTLDNPHHLKVSSTVPAMLNQELRVLSNNKFAALLEEEE